MKTWLKMMALVMLAPCAEPLAGAEQDQPGNAPMVEGLERLNGKEFEQGFLQQMIQHHRGAVEMAKWVAEHTTTPEVVAFSNRIVAAQTKEIDRMTRWLKDWDGVEPQKTPNPAAEKQMKAAVVTLQLAEDGKLDRQFLEIMIAHHKEGVDMARLVETKAPRAELLEFARQIIKDQTAEMDQMVAWRSTWFK